MGGVERHTVDEFDRYQLENIIEICQKSANLFKVSRQLTVLKNQKTT